MNEKKWLGSRNGEELLRWLNPHNAKTLKKGEIWPGKHIVVSDRKLRLFVAACCRLVPSVEVGWKTAIVDLETAADSTHPVTTFTMARFFHTGWDLWTLAEWASTDLHEGVNILRDIVGNPWNPLVHPAPGTKLTIKESSPGVYEDPHNATFLRLEKGRMVVEPSNSRGTEGV